MSSRSDELQLYLAAGRAQRLCQPPSGLRLTDVISSAVGDGDAYPTPGYRWAIVQELTASEEAAVGHVENLHQRKRDELRRLAKVLLDDCWVNECFGDRELISY